VEAKDVRAVVVADRVEQPPGRADRAEVEVADQCLLALADGAGEQAPVGADDDRIPLLDP
jgi:hypothetical protein